MIEYYYLNGELVPAETASLRVNDLAILRGAGVFDFFLVMDGQPLFLDDYIDRFFRSAERSGLWMDYSREAVREMIRRLIEVNGIRDAGIRLVLTGGYSPDNYTPVSPNFIIMAGPVRDNPEGAFEQGVKLMLVEYQREQPEVKSINYLKGISMIREMQEAGAFELLYHQQGRLREAVRSNFYLVTPDQRIVTPSDGILEGITRKHILRVARNHYQVEEREVQVEELYGAAEAFLTGSNKKVMPVTRIDDHRFGDGLPGPVTRHLMELFEAYRREHVRQAAVKS